MSAVSDTRVDPVLGTVVHVVQSRQGRPNLPTAGCPFCVGGLEAPEPYEVKSFPNRWPALGEGRCEVVLYTPDHDASFPTIGAAGIRPVIDLWDDRTTALRKLDNVEFVLVFENRGAEVGATIPHPHGQIYAFDHVPRRQLQRLEAGWKPDTDTASGAGDRLIIDDGFWVASTDYAPVFPISITVAPRQARPDLAALTDTERDGLAQTLGDLFTRLDALYEAPLPYMMWLNQAPTHWAGPDPWFNIEIVSPWRAAKVPRFIAAAEVATTEYFNPVNPEELAQRLRALS